jgi:predicted membrane channel-forming protein YqfA (hemolysin III family)
MGAWPRESLARLAHVLRPVAATGAALAVLTGLTLFATDARDYAAMNLFRLKMALLALANAAWHAGPRLATLPPVRQRLVGAASLGLWVALLVCGRLLGYV